MADERGEDKVVATNRKARHLYHVLETHEAGLVLLGPEVKSLRAGRANLVDAYARIRRGECILVNAHISPYDQAGRENPDPRRERKLLLHKPEIRRLQGKLNERGFTLVPLRLYFKQGRAKVELALVKGKRQVDKRETIRRREEERSLRRAVRRSGRG